VLCEAFDRSSWQDREAALREFGVSEADVPFELGRDSAVDLAFDVPWRDLAYDHEVISRESARTLASGFASQFSWAATFHTNWDPPAHVSRDEMRRGQRAAAGACGALSLGHALSAATDNVGLIVREGDELRGLLLVEDED
jgi:hypothetical protein